MREATRLWKGMELYTPRAASWFRSNRVFASAFLLACPPQSQSSLFEPFNLLQGRERRAPASDSGGAACGRLEEKTAKKTANGKFAFAQKKNVAVLRKTDGAVTREAIGNARW